MAESSEKIKYTVLTVDGKTYGPFPPNHEKKFKGLLHAKGVTVASVWLDGTEYRRQKAEGRRQNLLSLPC